MVVFICNACGDSLKKQQVDKHLQFACRRGQTISCVDCLKDFTAQSYKEHIKCFTEDEKYSAKGYQPKVNKGQVKQEQWIERLQDALTNVGTDRQLGAVLERMLTYDNIPRKKAKFENFMRNSFRSMVNPGMIERIWNIIETVKPPPPPAPTAIPEKQEENDEKEKADEDNEEPSPKKSKSAEEDTLPKFSLNNYVTELLAQKPSGMSFDKLYKKVVKASNDSSKFRPSKKMVDFDDKKLEKALSKLSKAGSLSFSGEEKERRVVLVESS